MVGDSMMRNVVGAVFLTSAAAAGFCSPYWVAWEDGWPEEQGWSRFYSQGMPAKRWLEDGALVIDSRESTHIYDYLARDMKGALDPDPGEMLIVQTRIKIHETFGLYDAGFGLFSDEAWAVGFQLDTANLYSAFEPGVRVSFTPGVFHSFELRSPDMRAYELYVDTELRLRGSFKHLVSRSFVSWGDGVQGAASLSRWDYFRVGVVVPEPSGPVMWMALVVFCVRRWLRRPARS